MVSVTYANAINLKLIHTFLLVAENRSFREAAAQAGRSQSAISMQIKALEDQLGVTLIIRTTRSLRLTHEGEVLLEQARRAMYEIEQGLRSLTETADLRRGQVTVACSPAFASTKLPAILARFKKDYSGVQVILKEHKSAELLAAVRSGEADFGVGPEIYDEMLEFRLVQSERLLALVPRSLIGEDRTTITLRELARLPLILFHPNTVLSRILTEAAGGLGVRLNTQYLCIQGQTLVALAEAGLGASVLTDSVADMSDLSATQRLVIVEPALERHFALIRARGQLLSAAAQRLYDLIDHTCSLPKAAE